MAKTTKNLSLDAVAVKRGEQYSQLHQTNISRLVSDFLVRLPLDEATRPLSPAVSRLLGVAAEPRSGTGREDADDYAAHLWSKYGRA